jgi:hypothetical protein
MVSFEAASDDAMNSVPLTVEVDDRFRADQSAGACDKNFHRIRI